MNLIRKSKARNIKISSKCSLSIRNTKDYGLHIAIFIRGKIYYRIDKRRLLRFGESSIINYVSSAPILIPLPLVGVILNGINDNLDIDDFYKIVEYTSDHLIKEQVIA